ncbi:hypothetical protein GWI33_019398 [Rhynchophorus ferrugineus]|uniref:Uncharacterized protein n=1 Tax=Rhynchophorus ferrugineus TaxID=354439 RepID=A0A834HUI9_RHYFE|nr:hypothetical protein GWI33_019398 [Rhynchophorus ferrugineus]
MENSILNLLSTSENNYEFPNMQSEATDLISINLSNIIYDTLKQKTLTSSTKRLNVLKFLNNISCLSEYHNCENFHQIYLDIYKECKIKNIKICNLIQDCQEEIINNKNDIYNDIQQFYEFKNMKRKIKINKLEFIKLKDQEILNLLNIKASKNFFSYEINKHTIIELFKNCNKLTDINVRYSQTYREKQIQFCYSLVNMNLKANYSILKHIMKLILEYKELQRFELEFLIYIWNLQDKHSEDFLNFLMKDFFFILEKDIINISTDLIAFEHYSELL